MFPMFDIIPRPGIPDASKEVTAHLCLNIQVGFKMSGRKKRSISQFFLKNRIRPPS
jgi:hypothetical protein